MRFLVFTSLIAVASLATPAAAMLRSPDRYAAASHIVPVALSCGLGHHRDAMGHCRKSFNLFRHHGRFKAYKRTHCTPVRTPHGPVGFCRI